jgi:hypothetical protein
MITDKQVRILMNQRRKGKSLRNSAAFTDISVNAARKYLRSGLLPSESISPHRWRTRPDPFADVADEITALLGNDPGLQAKTIFDHLQREHPGGFADGQLRSLQRQVKRWRAIYGPGKEVFFAQEHIPGELGASDFCHMTRLRVTIGGQPLEHLVYHFVLTYSNWEAISVCFGESWESLSHGLQEALWKLGGVPKRHRTDSLTAAVTTLGDRTEFTTRYQALMAHYDLAGEHTQPVSPNENGDVEQSHFRFITRIDQALMLRGNREFDCRADYERFLQYQVHQANLGRKERFAQECALLGPLPAARLDADKRLDKVRVSQFATIRVLGNTYSVPSRLIDERITACVHADTVDVIYAQQTIVRMPRLRGKGKSHIDYRHIIDALVRKPGAFEGYVHRAEMFPTSHFRIAYDLLAAQSTPLAAAKEYLRILKLAKDEGEQRVELVLRQLVRAGSGTLSSEAVRQALAEGACCTTCVDAVRIPAVDLGSYDALLTHAPSAVQSVTEANHA